MQRNEGDPVGGDIDMVDLAQRLRQPALGVETNMQPSLAQLTENGHFLGWWKPVPVFPEYAAVKVKACLHNETYGSWKFLKDYPRYTFDNPMRCDQRKTRVTRFTDKFNRTTAADRAEEEEEDTRSLYGIVRKSSRELFQEGFAFFESLLQKSLSRLSGDVIDAR